MSKLDFREDEQFAQSHQKSTVCGKTGSHIRSLSIALKSALFSMCYMHVVLFIQNRHMSPTFPNKAGKRPLGVEGRGRKMNSHSVCRYFV